jgi:hypothetical protein
MRDFLLLWARRLRAAFLTERTLSEGVNCVGSGAAMNRQKASSSGCGVIEQRPNNDAPTMTERVADALANEPNWKKVDTSPLLREMWASFRQDIGTIFRRHRT